jgi:uroporphyrinogen decarboxylase
MYEVFGYPILKKVFDYCSPDENDFRYQHSDSDMAHLIPILARFNLTGVNFGPNVLVDMIRPRMPKTRIDGCIAPLAIQRNDEEELVRQVKRDCSTAVAGNWRGLNIAAAGLTTYGSRLSSLRLMMQAIQNFGRYD